MPALLAFFGQFVGRLFGESVIIWAAFKLFLTFVCTMLLPIIFNNFLYDIIEIIKNFAAQQAGEGSLVGGMSFTGFMAWLLERFRVAECLAVIVSALVLRTALRMIPFVRLG